MTAHVELPGGVRLPYVEQGDPSDVTVLFLHGFLDSLHSFAPVLDRLPAWVHAFAITQRGHGNASRPSTGYGVPDLAADAAGFMDAMGIGQAVVVGHSMGSAVALRLALDHPGRVQGLVLAGASRSLRGGPAARAFWEEAASELTDPVDADLVRGIIEQSTARPQPEELTAARVRVARQVPARVWRAALQSRLRGVGDFEDQLDTVRAPTLIVWGDEDARYTRADQQALAAAVPEARLVVYAGCGHTPHWDEPDRFTRDLIKFLDTVEA